MIPVNLQEKLSSEPTKFKVLHVTIFLNSEALIMSWVGRKLKNVDSHFDFWDKSDPYLKFMKLRGDNSFVEVART